MWKIGKNDKRTPRTVARSPLARAAMMTAIIASLTGGAILSPLGSGRAMAASSCPKNTYIAEHSFSVNGVNNLHERLLTSTLHVVWCHDNTRVRKILDINVIPSETTPGKLAGWVYRGLTPGTSDNYYYNASGFPNSGYHVYRNMHWELCLLHVGCIIDEYIGLNMNVFMNGTAIGYGGSDRI